MHITLLMLIKQGCCHVENAIIVSMEGMTVAEYTFKRNDQVITLETKSAVKIDGIACR